MNGKDLRSLRLSKQLTQSEFGEALGLTGQYVGLMERDARPIETRTQLAALYVIERLPLNGRVKGFTVRDRLIDLQSECWDDPDLAKMVHAKQVQDNTGETFTFFIRKDIFEPIFEGLDS